MTVLTLARVEASLLVRSVLVLAGLLTGGLVTWFLIQPDEPLWWSADWRIGGGQLVLAMTVLIAAQLATGRPRRDAMGDLYASFPATATARTLAQLISLAGAAPASLLLLAAAVVMVQEHSAIGSPSVMALACGLVLVIAAGAVGIAIGARFPHPLAGALGALALFLPAAATEHVAPGAGIWLVPWNVFYDDLGLLPGPLAGYPPAGAHAAELAGVALLAGIVALAVTVRRARAWSGLAAAAILASTVIGVAGAVQLRPVPFAALDRLAAETADPASVQQCTTANQVRYCLYPGFGRDLPSLEAPVDGVLAHLPVRPGQALTVRQMVSLGFSDPSLSYGHPARQISLWNAQRLNALDKAQLASAIYLSVGSWPAAGPRLTDAHFNLALAAAEWAVLLLPGNDLQPGSDSQPCVALDQAREPITIWLAILATNPPAGELQDGLGTSRDFHATQVRDAMIPTWNFPGVDAGQIVPAGPQLTATGYLLAKAMTALPEQKVSQVLKGSWATWLNGRTTDAQLAAALGIKMPSIPLPMALRPGAKPGPRVTIVGQPGPQSPVCR